MAWAFESATSSTGDTGAGYWAATPSGVEIVDPGIPLLDYAAGALSSPAAIWKSQPSVRKVTGYIARNVASIPLHVFERTSDTDRHRDTTSELARLIASPSRRPGMRPFRFWQRYMLDGLLWDRSCLAPVRHPDGGLELLRIPPRRFRLASDSLGNITAVKLPDADGHWVEHDPADFIVDSGYSPSGAGGSSPLEALRDLLDEQAEAVAYRRQLWKRGARFSSVIERDGRWPSEESRNRFLHGLRAFTEGGDRAGSALLLEDGMKYAKAEGMSPKDLGDLDGRKLTDVEVANAYHVAPELVGAREGNFSNLDALRQLVYRDNLGPYIVQWEQALQPLVARYGGGAPLYIEANVEAKLRGSFEEQAKVGQATVGAPFITRNEQRARLNMPAVPGGDELVTPLNVLVGGQASPQDSAPADNGKAGGSRFTLPPKPSRKSAGLRVKSADQVTEEEFETAGELFRRFFARQSKTVVGAIGAGGDWWDGDRWDRELAAELKALAEQVADAIGPDAAKGLGFEPGDYDAERTRGFLSSFAELRAKWVNETTREALEAAVASDDEDDTPEAVFEHAEKVRSVSAGAAVMTAAAAFAVTEAARQLAPESAEKVWKTSSAHPRKSHQRLNGARVKIDEKFANGLEWPGSPWSGAEEAANCRCSVDVERNTEGNEV